MLKNDKLRQRAEALAREQAAADAAPPAEGMSAEAARQARHELRVCRIQLELQQAELRLALEHTAVLQASLTSPAAAGRDGRAPRRAAARASAPEAHKFQAGVIESLLVSIPDLIFYKDIDGVYVGCNPPFTEFVGRPKEQIIGRTDFDLFDKNVAEQFRAYDQSMLASGQSRHNEEEITYPDGRKILIDTLKTPYWSPDGKLIGVLGISRDITAHMRTEEQLRRTTDRLSLAVRAGGVGIWVWDVANNRLEWDEQMFRLYGIGPQQFDGVYEAWQAGLHPDDRQRCDTEIQLALRGEKEFDIEFRVRWPDGSTHTIRGFASVERDGAGHPLRLIGTNWDITAQKCAEETLRESEANFRTFFETVTDLILVSAPDGRVLFANSAVSHMLGYSPGELLNMHLLDLHPPAKRQEAEAIFGGMRRGERESCPLPLARKDGGLVPVETRVWPGKWNGVACIFGICKNLTEEQEAKQRFERLFRSNPSSIALSCLEDHRFLDVNDAFVQTLGYARDEILGKSGTELGLFTQPARYAAAQAEVMSCRRLADFDMQIRHKDGAILDGIFSGEVIHSQGRQYLLTVMVDITERKRAAAELARLSAIQHKLMDLASRFVNVPTERQDAAIDESLAAMGQLIHADRAYLFTYDFDAGIMSNTHEWCGPEISPEIDNLRAVPNAMLPGWVDAHRQGKAVHVPSVTALPPDGFLRQVLQEQGIRSLITLPLLQGDACLGFVGFDAVREERVWSEEELALLRVLAELYANFEARRKDESRTRELQRRLIEACDSAQAAVLAKSLFLANMSHEIRTPLNAVLGYAQIMQHECGKCENGRRLGSLIRGAEHLLELLTDLLELVRSDVREIALAPCDFDFHQILEDVRLMSMRHPGTHGLTLEVAHAADLPRFIHGDSGKIRQILVNLVGNAIKFTSVGGVRVAASLLPGQEPHDLLLAVDVADTGCGIAPDELERIFDLFEQSQHGHKYSKGAGLGLCLSRRYAQALGGDITVTSRPGEGSCFRLTFKARAASGGAAEQLRCGSVLRLAAEQAACHVLLVDDEPDNRDMLTAMLTAVGFTVEAVADAAQALDRLGRLGGTGGIDLVLMDKRLPEMDGYEAIGRLRALPGGREVPVVVVTASGAADEEHLARAAGADGYVSKPVRREQLLTEIGSLTRVRYEYEPLPPVTSEATDATPLDSMVAARLEPEQCRMLGEALRRGDIRRLRELIAALDSDRAALAIRMRALIDVYDYEQLHQLLEAMKGTTV